MTYPLAPRPGRRDSRRIDLDSFARAASLHPELVRRFVALGLLESTVDSAGQLWFTSRQLRSVARMQRLRAGLSLNYAALGLVLDLLDRITELERAARTSSRRAADRGTIGGRTWTPRS
jgi:pimeloyl-ACP methyl ester carboxylesterase